MKDINFFIPHQANLRITKYVQQKMGLEPEKMVSNIEKYGNTGCCGCGIGFAKSQSKFFKGNKILLRVFSGGYSYGAMVVDV
jgi:3-oxoacyl-[acyl-carrier-protein] synthase-3